MLRRYYNANDDTGGGTELPPAFGGDGVDGAALILDAINQANAEPDPSAAVADPATPPADPNAAPVSPDPAVVDSPVDDLILGRFKSKDDVIPAYQSLETEYTQTRQQYKDLERQVLELQQKLATPEAPDLFEFDSPFTTNPTNVQELEALATEHPDKAALWAIDNSARLDPDLVQRTINYWHERNPAQATAYMLQTMMQQFMPTIDQRLRPSETTHQETIIQNAVTAAEEQIGPTYAQYHDRILAAIEATPSLLTGDLGNPNDVRDSIVTVYAMLLGRDMLAKGGAKAQGAIPPPTPDALTVTTTQVADPTVNDDPNEAAIRKSIQDMILNAQ